MNRHLTSEASIDSDEEAYRLLPPYALVLAEYQSHRAAGESPQHALQATLALWRELRKTDRPSIDAARPRTNPL